LDPTPLLDRILDDEGLTEGLDEPEAGVLLRELAERVRRVAADTTDPALARRKTEVLCRQARAAAKAVAADTSADKAAVLRRRLADWPG
jgi:hypothetical protein